MTKDIYSTENPSLLRDDQFFLINDLLIFFYQHFPNFVSRKHEFLSDVRHFVTFYKFDFFDRHVIEASF